MRKKMETKIPQFDRRNLTNTGPVLTKIRCKRPATQDNRGPALSTKKN